MLGGCTLKAWEPARPTLPSISSRAPHKTHLPASEHDHDEVNDDMMFRRTPRRSFVRISGIIAFAPIKKTLRESRHGRASPAMCGDHAVELTQLTFTAGRSTGWRLQLRYPLLAKNTLHPVLCVLGKERVA